MNSVYKVKIPNDGYMCFDIKPTSPPKVHPRLPSAFIVPLSHDSGRTTSLTASLVPSPKSPLARRQTPRERKPRSAFAHCFQAIHPSAGPRGLELPCTQKPNAQLAWVLVCVSFSACSRWCTMNFFFFFPSLFFLNRIPVGPNHTLIFLWHTNKTLDGRKIRKKIKK